MTNYEHLEWLARRCEDVAATTGDKWAWEFYGSAARIFRQRLAGMTIAEAAAEWEGAGDDVL